MNVTNIVGVLSREKGFVNLYGYVDIVHQIFLRSFLAHQS